VPEDGAQSDSGTVNDTSGSTGLAVFRCNFFGCGRVFSLKRTLARHQKYKKHESVLEVFDAQKEPVTEPVTSSSDLATVNDAGILAGSVALNFGTKARATRGDFQCDFSGCGKFVRTKVGLAKHKTMLKHHSSELLEVYHSELFVGSDRIGEGVFEQKGLDIQPKVLTKKPVVVDQKALAGFAVKPALKLPNPNDTAKWEHLDVIISEAFDRSVSKHRLKHGSIDKIVDTLGNLIYDLICEEYGLRVPHEKKPAHRTTKPAKATSKRTPRFLEKLRKAKSLARKEAFGFPSSRTNWGFHYLSRLKTC
jgi:hypothetical protein